MTRVDGVAGSAAKIEKPFLLNSVDKIYHVWEGHKDIKLQEIETVIPWLNIPTVPSSRPSIHEAAPIHEH